VPPIVYKLHSLTDLPGLMIKWLGHHDARSTHIGIGIGRCVYLNTRIRSYQCVPVSSVL